MIPAININLEPCDAGCSTLSPSSGPVLHYRHCAATPVPVPCPIPRSVTFEVRLGKCACSAGLRGFRGHIAPHTDGCPARTVRVSCSIFSSDGAWATSEVDDMEIPEPYESDLSLSQERNTIVAACRELWALLKALVLGKTAAQPCIPLQTSAATIALFVQRDAVYAAIAKARRMEDGLYDALGDLPTGIASAAGRPVGARFTFAEQGLAAYVSRLVEQVGVME